VLPSQHLAATIEQGPTQPSDLHWIHQLAMPLQHRCRPAVLHRMGRGPRSVSCRAVDVDADLVQTRRARQEDIVPAAQYSTRPDEVERVRSATAW